MSTFGMHVQLSSLSFVQFFQHFVHFQFQDLKCHLRQAGSFHNQSSLSFGQTQVKK